MCDDRVRCFMKVVPWHLQNTSSHELTLFMQLHYFQGKYFNTTHSSHTFYRMSDFLVGKRFWMICNYISGITSVCHEGGPQWLMFALSPPGGCAVGFMCHLGYTVVFVMKTCAERSYSYLALVNLSVYESLYCWTKRFIKINIKHINNKQTTYKKIFLFCYFRKYFCNTTTYKQ